MTTRRTLIEALTKYSTSYAEEFPFINQFIQLLKHPQAFQRDHLPGHVTGSAWIMDETKNFILLTHHAKLNRWLQPGGHADGEENIIKVSLREVYEETGLRSLKLQTSDIFDIDIHSIPRRNDFPEHFHYDIRFLVQAQKSEKFTVSEESHDLAWVNIHDIANKTGNSSSMLRMAMKTLLL